MNDTLAWMLAELKANRLEVARLPSRDGYRRVVVAQNAPWYRDFCATYERQRGTRGGRCCRTRPRTIIRRRETVAALGRMLAGDLRGVYAERLREHAEHLERNGGGRATA